MQAVVSKTSIYRSCLRVLSVLVLFGPAALTPPLIAQQVLDLSSDSQVATSLMKLPGWSGNTVLAPLTLEATIQDIFPLTATEAGRVTVRILIRNKGPAIVEMPASQDQIAILKPGNRGKKELNVRLSVTPVGTEKTFYFPLAFTIGASSVPGSMILFSPGDSMVIRAVCNLSDSFEAEAPLMRVGDADIKVEMSQEVLEDEGYVIKNHSETVTTNNSVRVYWPLEIRQRGRPTKARATARP